MSNAVCILGIHVCHCWEKVVAVWRSLLYISALLSLNEQSVLVLDYSRFTMMWLWGMDGLQSWACVYMCLGEKGKYTSNLREDVFHTCYLKRNLLGWLINFYKNLLYFF